MRAWLAVGWIEGSLGRDPESLAGEDQARFLDVGAVGLEDLRPVLAVPVRVLRETPQRVTALDCGCCGRVCQCRRLRDEERPTRDDRAGVAESAAVRHQSAFVELGDLAPALAAPEVLIGDGPQRIALGDLDDGRG